MKACKNCNNCKPVYRKSDCKYWKCRLHYCILHEKITYQTCICDGWEKKIYKTELTADRFDEALCDIKAIMEFLKED